MRVATFQWSHGDPCPVCDQPTTRALFGVRTDAGLINRFEPCGHETPYGDVLAGGDRDG